MTASRFPQAPRRLEPRRQARDLVVTPAIRSLKEIRRMPDQARRRMSSRNPTARDRAAVPSIDCYTITMRSIIPAYGAVASASAPRTELKATDDRARDPAA